jgi:hypothetical protein
MQNLEWRAFAEADLSVPGELQSARGQRQSGAGRRLEYATAVIFFQALNGKDVGLFD